MDFFTPESIKKLHRNATSVLPVIDLMWQYLDKQSPVIDEIISNKECYYHVYILKKWRIQN